MSGRKYTGDVHIKIVHSNEALALAESISCLFTRVSTWGPKIIPHPDHYDCTYWCNYFGKRSVFLDWMESFNRLALFVYGEEAGIFDVSAFDKRYLMFIGDNSQRVASMSKVIKKLQSDMVAYDGVTVVDQAFVLFHEESYAR